MGDKQITTFERMCELTGRKPYQLASDIVLGELWEAGDNPGLRRLAREQRRWRLSLMRGVPQAPRPPEIVSTPDQLFDRPPAKTSRRHPSAGG
jgi:hypothetical protein